MKASMESDPKHEQIRGVLRLVGPALAVIGLVLTAVGLISFFSAFGTFQPPRYFWCAFLGLPLVVAGVGLSQFGYLGAVTRYVFGEVAPVQKETFNYLAQETQEGVQTLAHALGQGLAEGVSSTRQEICCPKCNTPNASESSYCSNCGAHLGAKTCPACQTQNEPAAHFCGHCGGPLD